MKRIIAFLIFVTLTSLLPFNSANANNRVTQPTNEPTNEPVSKSIFSGVAIDGKDTVAYHFQQAEQHKSSDGKSEFTVEWKGAKWRFATQADSDAFRADPEKYAPAYNGFCANALSTGHGLVKTDGSYWQIYDDQLYLFYSKKGRERWLQGDYKQYKQAADSAWEEILNRE